jgi:hypothetical protein
MAAGLANLSKKFFRALGNESPPFPVMAFLEMQATLLSLSE